MFQQSRERLAFRRDTCDFFVAVSPRCSRIGDVQWHFEGNLKWAGIHTATEKTGPRDISTSPSSSSLARGPAFVREITACGVDIVFRRDVVDAPSLYKPCGNVPLPTHNKRTGQSKKPDRLVYFFKRCHATFAKRHSVGSSRDWVTSLFHPFLLDITMAGLQKNSNLGLKPRGNRIPSTLHCILMHFTSLFIHTSTIHTDVSTTVQSVHGTLCLLLISTALSHWNELKRYCVSQIPIKFENKET